MYPNININIDANIVADKINSFLDKVPITTITYTITLTAQLPFNYIKPLPKYTSHSPLLIILS